jgi:hypothetical protein
MGRWEKTRPGRPAIRTGVPGIPPAVSSATTPSSMTLGPNHGTGASGTQADRSGLSALWRPWRAVHA